MTEIIVLRIVHVLAGMFWVGSALFNTFFLLPAMAQAGPAAGAVMAGMRQRHIFIVLPAVALVTILAGVRLMQITSANFSAAYFNSPRGSMFAWSGTAAIAAFVGGMLFGRPTGLRMARVQQALASAADDAERATLSARLARLQRLNRWVTMVVLALLIIAAAGMSAARYMF